MPSLLSPPLLAQFHADGFIIVRSMFDAHETALLRTAMEQDPEVCSHILDRLDAHGGATRIALWNRAGDSVYGMAARCARMVDTMEAILGGPVYHFQSKLTAKEPFVGGAWEWHQDYGYWYHNGCLFPHLASCQVALDRSTSANGCLQMVQGSHHLGRVDHVPVPGEGQNVADPARMRDITQRLNIVPCELEPGDAVFFHSKHAASFRPEPLAAPTLDIDLLLQSHRQRHREPRPRSLLCATRQGAGQRGDGRGAAFRQR
jgi:ectoine hydroxylase